MSDKLDAWVHRISEQEIPIFKHTVSAIAEVTQDDDSSASELAQVILQDASLTARILKIANSIHYNPSGMSINTISRAVFYIGFNTIRTISLSLAIINALLKYKTRDHVLELMAQSLHAAVQARAFAVENGDDSPEEVFIASLLYNVGEIAFWCVAGKEGEAILDTMEQKHCDAETAQLEVLGFTFKQLTLGLTSDWHLGDLLGSALKSPSLKNPRIQTINLAQDIAGHSTRGWKNNDTRVTMEKIARHLGLSDSETTTLVHEQARKAVATAQQYGAGIAAQFIPSPDNIPELNEEEINDTSPYLEPDPTLQLNILRDLTIMLSESPNPGIILETILEGIYRGIGMDRAVFAMLTPDKSVLRAKNCLGINAEQFSQHFSFNIKSGPNIFSQALASNESIWINPETRSKYQQCLPVSITDTLETAEFYISPISVNGRPIGLFYADRKPSGRKLDINGFESLKLFAQQASMAISHISNNKR